MLRTQLTIGGNAERLYEFFSWMAFIYRIAAILGISREYVPTMRCKTMVLRRARLLLVAD